MTQKRLNRSVVKALEVLELFSSLDGGFTATEIAQALRLSQGSLYPILHALEIGGYLNRDSSKRYRLGYKFLQKANLVLQQSDVQRVAKPFLKNLATKLKVNVHLGILYGGKVLYLWRETGSETVIISEIIGWQEPAYCTALGKILLSSLSDDELEEYLAKEKLVPFTNYTITEATKLRNELAMVQTRGYAISDEEAHEGVVGLAAPVRDFRQKIIAGVSISVPKARFEGEKETLIQAVTAAAAAISKRLGYGRG